MRVMRLNDRNAALSYAYGHFSRRTKMTQLKLMPQGFVAVG
jgi:hypothetical protein